MEALLGLRFPESWSRQTLHIDRGPSAARSYVGVQRSAFNVQHTTLSSLSTRGLMSVMVDCFVGSAYELDQVFSTSCFELFN